jgi:hypothetical protein
MTSVQEKAERESPVTVQRMFRAQYGKNPPDVILKFTCSKIKVIQLVLLLKYYSQLNSG